MNTAHCVYGAQLWGSVVLYVSLGAECLNARWGLARLMESSMLHGN